jgi:hypothetical protein
MQVVSMGVRAEYPVAYEPDGERYQDDPEEQCAS